MKQLANHILECIDTATTGTLTPHLIPVPIQDRAQQIQIYKIINLPVPVGNYSMRYTMDNKYLGITYDRTKVMDMPEDQFKLCKEAK